jgi:hypothetical protein
MSTFRGVVLFPVWVFLGGDIDMSNKRWVECEIEEKIERLRIAVLCALLLWILTLIIMVVANT